MVWGYCYCSRNIRWPLSGNAYRYLTGSHRLTETMRSGSGLTITSMPIYPKHKPYYSSWRAAPSSDLQHRLLLIRYPILYASSKLIAKSMRPALDIWTQHGLWSPPMDLWDSLDVGSRHVSWRMVYRGCYSPFSGGTSWICEYPLHTTCEDCELTWCIHRWNENTK